MIVCICGSASGKRISVIERQLGLGDEFAYIECGNCGTLRISDTPDNIQKYYSSGYYSFSSSLGWRDRLQPIAMWLALRSRHPALPRIHFQFPSVVQSINIRTSDSVLDVGSGVYGMATFLRMAGHRKTLGIDPFIGVDVVDKSGTYIQKAYLRDIPGQWDVITFNHSLEHVCNPLEELNNAKRLLADRGRIVVRIPVVAYAYREYGENWYQIDAPRHLFVPTETGFRILCHQAGLSVVKIVYDSDYLQFWQSENYRSGKMMAKLGSPEYWGGITRSERRKLNRRAEELNQAHEGDQAMFVLTPE